MESYYATEWSFKSKKTYQTYIIAHVYFTFLPKET